MKTLLKVLGVLVLVVLVAAAGVYAWATVVSNRLRAETYETHRVDFPIPFPLDPAEVATLGLDEAAAARLARDRATERGRHLVTSRYGCIGCHGGTFAGGVMIDAFPIGRLLAPNLTLGQGSRTADYTPADWDRIVRHGVLPDGREAVMPSMDYFGMSDQELSDIIVYIRTMPAQANVVPPPTLGPLGKFLRATGEIVPSAQQLASHTAAHAAYPPEAVVSVEFGKHLAGVCTGCHRADLTGGRIVGGDPSWPPARNLTQIGDWTYEQFVAAMRQARRPDGTPIRIPMAEMAPFAQGMTDVELRALWTYLQSRPPTPTTE